MVKHFLTFNDKTRYGRYDFESESALAKRLNLSTDDFIVLRFNYKDIPSTEYPIECKELHLFEVEIIQAEEKEYTWKSEGLERLVQIVNKARKENKVLLIHGRVVAECIHHMLCLTLTDMPLIAKTDMLLNPRSYGLGSRTAVLFLSLLQAFDVEKVTTDHKDMVENMFGYYTDHGTMLVSSFMI